MSLINDMLNDLEKRGVTTKDLSNKKLESEKKPETEQKKETTKVLQSEQTPVLEKKIDPEMKPEVKRNLETPAPKKEEISQFVPASKLPDQERHEEKSVTQSVGTVESDKSKKKSINGEPIYSGMIIHPKTIKQAENAATVSKAPLPVSPSIPPKKPINLASQNIELKPPKIETKHFNFSKKFIFLVGIIIVICLILFFWPKKVQIEIATTPKTPAVSIQPVKPVAKNKMPVSVSKPIQTTDLVNINVSRTDNLTHLQLSFDQTVHYQVQVNKDHSSIQFTFSDAKFVGQLPQVQNDPIIQNLAGKQEDKNYILTLKTLSKTEIKKVQLSEKAPFVMDIHLYNAHAKVVSNKAQEEAIIAPSGQDLVDQQYEDALALVAQDDISSAVNALKQTVDQTPRFEPARQTLVVLLMKQQEYVEAQHYVDAGLKLTPDSIDLIMVKARLLSIETQFGKALKVLNRVSPPLATNLNYYGLMAYIQQHLGNYLVAANLYNQLLQHDPNNSSWWLGLGLVLESANRPNAAVQAYQNALSSGNLSPNIQAFVQTKLSQLAGSSQAVNANY